MSEPSPSTGFTMLGPTLVVYILNLTRTLRSISTSKIVQLLQEEVLDTYIHGVLFKMHILFTWVIVIPIVRYFLAHNIVILLSLVWRLYVTQAYASQQVRFVSRYALFGILAVSYPCCFLALNTGHTHAFTSHATPGHVKPSLVYHSEKSWCPPV